MGLDGVELVMAYEEEFGIIIADEQAEKFVTPGDVIEFIAKSVGASRTTPCPSQQSFHRLRRVFMRTLDIPRKQFRLDLPLEKILPRAGRRKVWAKLKEQAEVQSWPELRRPPWLVLLIVLTSVASVASISLSFLLLDRWLPARADFAELPLIFAAMSLPPVMCWIWVRATRGLKIAFSKSNFTVKDLVHSVVFHDISPTVKPETKNWTREQIAQKVREITIEQLGINPESYRENARFVQDLGVG